MIIYIGSDHRGYSLKLKLIEFLQNKGFKVVDKGNSQYESKDDYPDLAKKVAYAVVKNKNSRGITICGSGAGVCIAANRITGVRAVETHDPGIAKASRRDDDTNILCLGADFISLDDAKKVVLSWLKTRFIRSNRHVRRIRKLDKIAF